MPLFELLACLFWTSIIKTLFFSNLKIVSVFDINITEFY